LLIKKHVCDKIRLVYIKILKEKGLLMKKYEHVIVIGVDGMGNFNRDTDTPNFDRIFDHGAVTYNCLSMVPTISAQNWVECFSAVIRLCTVLQMPLSAADLIIMKKCRRCSEE